jgi:YcaO-like protein with predicted kinase domain
MHEDLLERSVATTRRTPAEEVAYQLALGERSDSEGIRTLSTSVREVGAESTLRAIQPLFDDFGISQLIDISLDGVPACPVFQVIRDDIRSVFFNAGKGFTRVESMVSGLMEAIEVHCFERADRARVIEAAMVAQASPDATMIAPQALGEGRIARIPVRDAADALLVQGVDHRTGEAVLFHAGNVYLEFSDGEKMHASPNGIASGNSVSEALCHALSEILERHALAGFYRHGKASNNILYQQLERVAPPTGQARMHACLAQLRRRHIEAEFILISTEADVSVFICFLDLPMGHGVRGAVQGYGAHHDPQIAMSRALGEAVQILALSPVTDIGNAVARPVERVVMTSKQAAALDPRTIWEQRVSDHLFLAGLRGRLELTDYDYAAFPDDAGTAHGSSGELLDRLLAGLAAMGCEGVYSCVISPPALPVAVVKCFCIGLDTIPGL